MPSPLRSWSFSSLCGEPRPVAPTPLAVGDHCRGERNTNPTTGECKPGTQKYICFDACGLGALLPAVCCACCPHEDDHRGVDNV